MKKALASWTVPYEKPVLTHHNTHEGEPIGRVKSARFVSAGQFGKPCVELTLEISDKEAIEKVKDGRYVTVSIGTTAKSVLCSICGTDLVEEGIFGCEHTRGQTYDDRLCYWVVKDISNEEVSFVNSPADINAVVVSTEDSDSITEDGPDTSEASSGVDGAEVSESDDQDQAIVVNESINEDDDAGDAGEEQESAVEPEEDEQERGTGKPMLDFSTPERAVFAHRLLHVLWQKEDVDKEEIKALHEQAVQVLRSAKVFLRFEGDLDEHLSDDLKAHYPIEKFSFEGEFGGVELDALEAKDLLEMWRQAEESVMHLGVLLGETSAKCAEAEEELEKLQALLRNAEAQVENLNRQVEALNSDKAELLLRNSDLAAEMHQMLAERVVEAKIDAGLIRAEERDDALQKHIIRSKESLLDSLQDLQESAVRLPSPTSIPKLSNPGLAVEGESNAEVITEKSAVNETNEFDIAYKAISMLLKGNKTDIPS